MPGLLGRKWPVAVARPMWPFFTAGLVILYGVNSFANVMMTTDEFKNDPRNPIRSNGAAKAEAGH